MAVVFDAVGPSAAGTSVAAGTSLNWSHTCSGSNRLLTVGVSLGISGADTGITTTVTYNGVSMTSAGKVHSNNDVHGYAELFYLVAPTLGANTVAVTASAAADLECGSVSFTGVNQSSPVANATTAAGNTATPTVVVASVTGNMVVDAVCCGSTLTASGQTSRWTNNQNGSSAGGNGAQSTAAGASSVTMSYSTTADWWGMVGMSIVASNTTPPTFIASYSVASYTTTTTPKTASVTTQAGDVLVIYGGTEDQFSSITTPTGNGVTFTLQQSVTVANFCTAYIWTGTDSVGGTNWTLSADVVNSQQWGFTCLVFRGSSGIGASAQTNVASGAPSLNVTTTQANSALVLYNADWVPNDGSGRVWNTISGVTPTAGNGLERNYTFSASHYTSYGAYYNDAVAIGVKTVGLSAPTGQKYSIAVVEVKGAITVAPPIAVIAWLRA